MSFEPKRLDSCFSRNSCYHFRTLLSIRALCLSVAFIGLLYWLAAYESSRANSDASKTARGDLAILGSDLTGNLQFFPASNPKIHVCQLDLSSASGPGCALSDSMSMQYVGRWTATPNRLRRDGTFPGLWCRLTAMPASCLS